MKKSVIALTMAVILSALAPAMAFAADLPKKVDVQVPASAGGGTDVAARQLVQYINENYPTNLTVKNNTDGSGVVAYETVRSAKKDGSTILFFHTTMLLKYATGVYAQSPKDSFKVAAVGLPTEKGGYVLVVPTESGVTDLDGFIALANEKAGELRIGIENGGSSHIMSGIMSEALGITLRTVESGPDTEKLTNLVGGSIDCALVNANQAKQYIEGEKVNAIACFSATDEGGRNSVLPDVPSFKELGYDCVFGTYFFVLLPKDADDEVAAAYNEAFTAAAADPAVSEILSASGFGMEFVSVEESAELLAAQQDSLYTVCEALGLTK